MKPAVFSQRSGFTLLEIMMVVAIIGLLAGAAVTSLSGNLLTAKETTCKADIQNIQTQLMVYESMNGFAPSTEQGLKALVEHPTSTPAPRSWRRLLKELPKDPFGYEYNYTYPGKHNPDSYDVFSSGKDGIPGTEDDIGNWKK